MSELSSKTKQSLSDNSVDSVDAVVVGAGFAGLYQLYRLRQAGLSVRVIERAEDVGGTWYWNRYPGARCDIESIYYSYSFDEDLQSEWKWSHRYATQPEILRYINHVADRFNLREDITFKTSVTAAHFNEEATSWEILTSTGERIRSTYFIMATGVLSNGNIPDFKGRDSFVGESYFTGDWPHEGVDFTGKRVGIIGTGSSSIQSAPIIAKEAEHLTVFQRTPQFAIPAWNKELSDEEMVATQENYGEIRRLIRESIVGIPYEGPDHGAVEASQEDLERQLEWAWDRGGYLMLTAYPDLLTNEESNKIVGDWVKKKIRARINDPKLADKLMPEYPFGAKRLCVDTEYFEIYNRDNVTLADLRESALQKITPKGVMTEDGVEYELDILIFATGFDAMTGALLAVDIRGRGGLTLEDKWSFETKNYLGVTVNGFPNFFMITGPGSPGPLYNMVPGIEQNVDFVTDAILYMQKAGLTTIEPRQSQEQAWTRYVNWVAEKTVYPKANSWYSGKNIPGKVQGFMPYAGGGLIYNEYCNQVVAAGYRGFTLASKVREPELV